MPDTPQSEELQRLREQVAELTKRVYRLEASQRGASVAADAVPQVQASDAARPENVIATPLEPSPPVTKPLTLPAPRASSLESRIGGQWLNRIGIVAVLVGVSYFLKFAFENNWIGPATQVLIGLLAGVALLFWSERFRVKGYPAFAYSLKAVAIGALYLSLWAASQFYHLVPPLVSFFGMAMVTLIYAAISLRQNSELLAALALLGGFLTPVLISTNKNQEVALFCYLALLDLGIVWMVVAKGWRRLLLGSFIGTSCLFAAWASGYYSESQLGTTLAFATFFFLLYAAAPLLVRLPAQTEPTPNIMIALALLNAACYFGATYLMLIEHHRFELSWLAVALAAFFFVLTRALQRREEVFGAVAAPLYLALGVGFLTVAIPLKLEGHWNTLGWLVEAGALFWAADRGKSLLLRVLGGCAFVSGVVRLLAVDAFDHVPLLINARFGLYLAAIGALSLLAYFATKKNDPRERIWLGTAIVGINVLALLALHFEIVDFFQPQFAAAYSQAERQSVETVQAFTYSAVWMIYGSCLMLVGFWKKSAFLRWQAIVLLAATVIKVFLFDIGTLERGYRIAAFIALGTILLAVSFFYQRSRVKAIE